MDLNNKDSFSKLINLSLLTTFYTKLKNQFVLIDDYNNFYNSVNQKIQENTKNIDDITINLNNNYYTKDDIDSEFDLLNQGIMTNYYSKTDIDSKIIVINNNINNLSQNLNNNYYNKQYIDNNFLSLNGGTLQGNLTAPTFIGNLNGNANTSSLANKVSNKLIFTGGFVGEYDGSSELNVIIPTSGTTEGILTIQLNGGTTEDVDKITFNGATNKSINITPESIGAITQSILNNYLPLTGGTLTGSLTAPIFNGDLNGNATSANKVNNKLSFIGYQTKSYDGSQAIEVEIPDKTSQLTNDSNFATTDYVDNKEFVGLNKDSIIRYPKDLPIPEGYELVEEQFSALTDANNELILQAPLTAPQNLLINGNFKINQRGQTSYVNNTSTPTYTLDMWQLAYGTINVLDNGIKITPYATQAFLNQKTSDDLTDKQVTLVLKETNGEMHILQGVASKTQVLSSKSGNVTLSIGYISETNLYKIGTTYDAETFVEYIDLFEGTIAYPHVEEDDATALMRCQTKTYSIVNSSSGHYIALGTCYVENSSIIYATVDIPCLTDTPSIEVNASDLRLIQSSGTAISNISVANYNNGKLYLVITPSSSVTAGDIYLLGLNEGKTITFTCEPL